VTEETIAELGFRRSPPAFECLVADVGNGSLAGVLVFYVVPFAIRAQPTFYMKELYIRSEDRGQGIGEALMRVAAAEAIRRACVLMKWQVATWNTGAASFYTRLGATPDPVWVDYQLSADAIGRLAASVPTSAEQPNDLTSER